jgi:hypothetical protein
LKQEQESGHRNQSFQRENRDAGRAEYADLAKADRHFRELVARIHEGQHRGQKEQDVKHQIELRLGARLQKAVDHVGAHMPVARERVSPRHQEQCAISDVTEIERPGRRSVQYIADEDLVTDAQGQHQDQPCKALADPQAERVDEEQEALHIR